MRAGRMRRMVSKTKACSANEREWGGLQGMASECVGRLVRGWLAGWLGLSNPVLFVRFLPACTCVCVCCLVLGEGAREFP